MNGDKMVYLHKGGKLLKLFKKKYGKPIEITSYPKPKKGKATKHNYAHTSYSFKGGRWVQCAIQGEMAWDGKKNIFNIKNEA